MEMLIKKNLLDLTLRRIEETHSRLRKKMKKCSFGSPIFKEYMMLSSVLGTINETNRKRKFLF